MGTAATLSAVPASTGRQDRAPGADAGARLRSVDILRGLVCVLMAIDHVRVYAGVPAGGPTAGIFFTRWVTHFVAPAFCLFAGTGAFFLGRRLKDPGALARFLVSRGLMLVLLEITLIRFTWTFSLDYSTFILAGVIWMLGWCMVLLAAFVRVPAPVVGWIGVGMIAAQQAFALVPQLVPASLRSGFGYFWEFIYSSGLTSLPGVSVLYVLVPWLGVMMAGYGFGVILLRDDAVRRRLCLWIGLGATGVFLVATTIIASAQGDGDGPPMYVRMLNMQKYPPSQLFLLMTLGPLIALLPYAERARGRLAGALETFGRVPLFYYLLHIPAIHVAAIIVMQLRGTFSAAWYATAPYATVPPAQRWSLGLLYLVWALVVAGVLYPACRWYARVKAERPAWWMRYL